MFAVFEMVMSFGVLALVAAPLILEIADDIRRDRGFKADRLREDRR